MSVSLSTIFNGYQSFLPNGLPNFGGKIYTYLAGTTTPATTYTNSTGSIPNANPIILSAGGVPPSEIWLTDGVAYKLVIKDLFDVLLPSGTFDNITGAGSGNSALSANLVAPGGSSLVGFLQAGAGAVPITLQDKGRQVVSVKDFGVTGDGTTNDLAALQVASAAVTSNYELHFPPGVYLLDWTGTKPEKSVYALDLFQLSNVRITGNKATIKIISHDTNAYGGLMFLHARACKNLEVTGFHSDMSFVGSNTSAACYPESGFMYAHNTNENSPSGPVPAVDQLANVHVHNCSFDIRSQYGAYTTSPNPYNGDSNNGGKYYSVFIRGEQADPVYSSQNKGVNIHDLYYTDTHHGYGIWVWGFSDVQIHHNNFVGYAVRTANSTNTTLGGSVPAIRCQKFFTRNWRITDNIIQGRVAPLRTGALDGSCAFISFQQEATAYDPESVVTIANNTLVVGSNPSSLVDRGIQILCGGNFDIYGNTLSCSSAIAAAIGMEFGDTSSSMTAISQYLTVRDNTFATSFNLGQPIVYTSASNTSAAARTIKSFIIKDNVFAGYYGGVMQKATIGATYEGAILQMVTGNTVNGSNNTAIVPANVNNIPFDIYVEQSTDVALVRHNLIRSCYIGIRGSGPSIANCDAKNNKVVGAVLKPMSGINNYAPSAMPTVATFLSAAPVVVTGSPNTLFGVMGLALDATGLVKDRLAGTYPGGTTLVPAPTGFTWQLFQWDIGDAA